MGFLEALQWRGMVQEYTPGIEEYLAADHCAGYIGFDPTAPSLGLGNYVQIMILRLFQQAGHQPVVLMGGATGRIGDPSGKDQERTLLDYDVLDRNLKHQQQQIIRLLQKDDRPFTIVNNYDFYKDMNVLDFLRDVGKSVTVNYMMAKESVRKRIETGISFTEFSYQLIQAYDFQCLYQRHNCRLQMGGSDQWGNITSGTEFIRKNLNGKAYALTTPLFTKSDGSKFGKSEKGNIFLDAALTSPYAFYQFWINADDKDLPKLMRYFMLIPREELEGLESQYAGDPVSLKKIVAEYVTQDVHGQEALESARRVSELLFHPKADRDLIQSLTASELDMVGEEVTAFHVPASIFTGEGAGIMELLAEHCTILTSKAEVRRAIQNNAISLNKTKITTHEYTIQSDQLLHGAYLLVENGKKNKYLIKTKD